MAMTGKASIFFPLSLIQKACIVSQQWSLEDLDITTMVCFLWTIVCRLLILNRGRVLAKGGSCFGNNNSQVRCGRRRSLLFTRHSVSRNQLCTYDCKWDESHTCAVFEWFCWNYCSISVFWHRLHFAMNVSKATRVWCNWYASVLEFIIPARVQEIRSLAYQLRREQLT